MSKKLILIFLVALSGRAFSSTSITTATISGHWTPLNSPYLIYNNVRIDSAQTLLIDPGVEVIFQGPYGIDVAGMLCAKGTVAKPILFHAQDTTGWTVDTVETGGWRGIHYLRYTSPVADTSSFEYCHVYPDLSILGQQVNFL